MSSRGKLRHYKGRNLHAMENTRAAELAQPRSKRKRKANTMEKLRGCRHVFTKWVKEPHPKYGSNMPHFVKVEIEVECDQSCGGRS